MPARTEPVNSAAPAILSAYSGVCAACGQSGIESSRENDKLTLRCPRSSCGAVFRCPCGEFPEAFINNVAKAGGVDELFIHLVRFDLAMVKAWRSPDFVLTESAFAEKYRFIAKAAILRRQTFQKLHAHGWLTDAPHPPVGPPDSAN